MVHSFAKKEVKGKEGESTYKSASGPVAKFVSQMRGIEPCTLASKMKGKQMTSNQNQLHKELRRLWGGQGQFTALSAQVSMYYPNSIVCETCVLGHPFTQGWKPSSVVPGGQPVALGGSPELEQLSDGLLYSCCSIDLSKNDTPV